MPITLTSEQETWLKARVARGEFASVEDAVRQFIDGLMAEDMDDLAWAKPYVDEARDAVARGEYVTLEEHKAHNAALLAALRGLMASLIVSNQAQADTDFVLRDLVATAGHAVAARYAKAFENLYERLKSFPDSGAPRPAVSPIARIGVISPYLVIYEFDPASGGPVTIQRIVHGRRKITGRMLCQGRAVA